MENNKIQSVSCHHDIYLQFGGPNYEVLTGTKGRS